MAVVRSDPRSGRLVRSFIVPPRVVEPRVIAAQPVGESGKAETGNGDPAIRELAERTAKAYDVDPDLVNSVIEVESNYNPRAVSNKGAQGLMQLIPSTARRFGVKDTFDARENIEGGVKYLKHLQSLYNNDLRLALAAYNAGEGAVSRYGSIPPYPETENYVYQVGKKLGQARRAAEARNSKGKPSKAEPANAAAPVETHRPLEQVVDSEGRVYLRTR